MSYYFAKTVEENFENSEIKVKELLKQQGFGVLTEIDVQATLKMKLNADFRKYNILGACNPPFAYKALLSEGKIGLMLPCNVVIQETGNGFTEVAVIDPLASMSAVQNESLSDVAVQIQHKLKAVIDML